MPLLDSLYNFARWLAGSREEAEDLVQEAYLKGWKGFSSFEPGTNFRAWMFRILRNSFLNSRTGLKNAAPIPLEAEDDPAMPVTTETPESILISRSQQEMLQTAIEELPVIFREVILLCDVEGMGYQDIADTLGIPIGTVMSRLARARKALRSAVQARMQRAGGS